MPVRSALTDVGVRAAKPPRTGTITIWDTAVRGFGLRVSQGGTKTFFVMTGRERSRVRIGHYPQWSVKDARQQALKTLADRAGKPAPKRVSFESAFEQFKIAHTSQKRPSTRREIERLITQHFLPKLRTRSMADIAPKEITNIIDSLLDRPGACSHAFAVIRLLFRWSVKRKIIERSPIEGMEAPVPPSSRDRVLTDDELVAVYRNAVAQRFTGGKIVQLLILTGQRRGEIGALRGEWIDCNAKTITLPSEITKNHRTHTFPYGEMVAEVLKDLPKKGYLFPARGSNGDKSFCGWSKLKNGVDPGCPSWTLHDLRRTFATNLAALDVPPHVIERILNHASGTISGVSAIYNRFSYLDDMRAALQKLETRLHLLLTKPEAKNVGHVSGLYHTGARSAS